MTEHVPVLICGGGPVGMALALDLGWREVPCIVVEQTVGPPTNPRCNTTAARSMELFRRLGLAEKIRSAGLPDDWPGDMVYRTRYTGDDLVRSVVPSPTEVMAGDFDEDLWPTPEPQHRISQIYLEPILRAHAARYPCIDLREATRLVSFEQSDDVVRAEVEAVETGERSVLTADYLIGCDGGASMIRRGLGIKFQGVSAHHETVSMYLRSPELLGLEKQRSWWAFSINPDGISNTIAIDGKELWLNHTLFPAGTDTSALDPGRLLEQSLGARIDYEELGVVRWTGRRLVADRYREGRVLLAGDAAHIWTPMAGFGMNAGIHDAATLAWMLAAVRQGWAGDGLLDAYEADRRPVGEQVAKVVEKIAVDWLNVPGIEHVEEPGEVGDRAREAVAKAIAKADRNQANPVGLNFGYHYAHSPLVVADGEDPPPLEIGAYRPTTCPGARLPHFWRRPGVSIFDELGPYFTLLRVGEGAPSADATARAFERVGVPLAVLDVPEPQAVDLYEAPLVLVRPDQHVAWRGDAEHPRPQELADRVRGAINDAVGQES